MPTAAATTEAVMPIPVASNSPVLEHPSLSPLQSPARLDFGFEEDDLTAINPQEILSIVQDERRVVITNHSQEGAGTMPRVAIIPDQRAALGLLDPALEAELDSVLDEIKAAEEASEVVAPRVAVATDQRAALGELDPALQSLMEAMQEIPEGIADSPAEPEEVFTQPERPTWKVIPLERSTPLRAGEQFQLDPRLFGLGAPSAQGHLNTNTSREMAKIRLTAMQQPNRRVDLVPGVSRQESVTFKNGEIEITWRLNSKVIPETQLINTPADTRSRGIQCNMMKERTKQILTSVFGKPNEH
ncbi:unnamed protein product [Owenia fusiformis]|uniref:Uncharacterized protein n=1 Tax=Owenia fusiformis TaxID=6347 RepID=A0A8S4Q8Z4_OWEFU|nr:unnamed protein product [Owenia fusiformis]